MATMAVSLARWTVPQASSSAPLSSCSTRCSFSLRTANCWHHPKSIGAVVVHCSSRPRKKCTAHHNKTRPKKHNPYDKNRKPAQYPPLPEAPPIFVIDDIPDASPPVAAAPSTSG